MLWIALVPGQEAQNPSAPDSATAPADIRALSWWALQFSPRVCVLEEAVLAELESSARLFGGKRTLLERMRLECAGQGVAKMAAAPTALAALALVRQLHSTSDGSVPTLACAPRKLPSVLDALPLGVLSAVEKHAATLQRLGCRTLADVRALPRGGISRRFDADLLAALDRAYGQAPEIHEWVVLPEQFAATLEFLGRIEVAESLMFGANRLLLQLKAWLAARQCGVTAITLHWEHDLQRRSEANSGHLEVRTGEATRDMQHLARLLSENLARTTLNAPVVSIRLEASVVEALPTASGLLLAQDTAAGESFQQLVERLSARLGADKVVLGTPATDHRPQRMQSWQNATGVARKRKLPALPGYVASHPSWILPQPLRLAIVHERPVYQGPLTLLAGPERIEHGWWEKPEDLNLRDYFIAESEYAGLLWIYRERLAQDTGWYLHGIYG